MNYAKLAAHLLAALGDCVNANNPSIAMLRGIASGDLAVVEVRRINPPTEDGIEKAIARLETESLDVTAP